MRELWPSVGAAIDSVETTWATIIWRTRHRVSGSPARRAALRRAAPCERPSRSSSLRSWPRGEPITQTACGGGDFVQGFPDRFPRCGFDQQAPAIQCPGVEQDATTSSLSELRPGVARRVHVLRLPGSDRCRRPSALGVPQLRLRLGRVLVEDGVVTLHTPPFGDSDVPAAGGASPRSGGHRSWPPTPFLCCKTPRSRFFKDPPCKASRDFSI